MGELGKRLTEARRQKNISLEQVDADIKIKPRYIEALEAEEFNSLPSGPAVRGFLRNYAAYLGLDATEILNLYNNAIAGADRKEGNAADGIPFMDISMDRRRRIMSIDTFVTLLIIVALLAGALYFIYTQYVQPRQKDLPANTTVVEYKVATQDVPATPVLQPTPTPPPTATPTSTPTPTPQYYTGVAVELLVRERSWAQILVDDVKVFEGTLEAGDKPNWAGNKRVAIRAGNGGGIEVFVNGESKGLMGEAGQVIDKVWEKVDETPGAEVVSTPSPEATAEEGKQ